MQDHFGAGESFLLTKVGAILLLFGTPPPSSGSDWLATLASLFPSTVVGAGFGAGAGAVAADMGVIGGVQRGSPAGAELVAATLGTLPIIGVGLLVITPGKLDCCVAMDDAELDLVGLKERAGIAGEGTWPWTEANCLAGEGAEGLVGVGRGEAWLEFEMDMASDGLWL